MKTKLALLGLALSLGLATPSLAADYGSNSRGTDNQYGNGREYGREYGRDYQEARWRPAQWQVIGSRTVSYRAERDIIPAAGRARYSQIKLCVYGEPVRMIDFDVRFRNGGSQDVSVRNVLGEGQCTRVIDLTGRQRDISTISVVYKAVNNGRRYDFRRNNGALVRVFAR